MADPSESAASVDELMKDWKRKEGAFREAEATSDQADAALEAAQAAADAAASQRDVARKAMDEAADLLVGRLRSA